MDRCPYCFKPIPENGICDCHYEESQNARIEDALRPGSIVGAAYQIGAVLGKGGFGIGGFGITYCGYDLNMERIVAIKEFFLRNMVTRGRLVPRPGVRPNEVITLMTENNAVYRKSLDLFYREARALSILDKLPNVVHAHHIFLENGTAYIVMEYVEGVSLSEEIRRRGRIPEKELLPLLDPMLSALEKVHAAGILHRDIAPDNIMVENGQPVLVDFGAARLGESHETSLLLGIRGYPSPEQIAEKELDPRSDIYSLGATYYKALSGTNPQDAVARMLNDQVVPLHVLVPDVRKEVSDAVMKAMAVDPDKRFASVAEFRKKLQSLPPQPPTPPKKPFRWLIPLLIIAAAGCVFLFRDKLFSGSAGKIENVVNTQSMEPAVEAEIAQTQTAVVLLQTEMKETQEAFSAEQTKTAEAAAERDATQEVIAQMQTKLAEDNSAMQATQTKAAEPTASPTPKPTMTSTKTAELTPVLRYTEGTIAIREGDLITLGSYEQDNNKSNGTEAIEWQVLTIQDNRALLISRYGLDAMPYYKNSNWYQNGTWETSTIRQWLNNDFYVHAYEDVEKDQIVPITNLNRDNPEYGTKGGNNTEDKIFLLSIDEAEKYFKSDEQRECESTAYAEANGAFIHDSYGTSWWWLRSPGQAEGVASVVIANGQILYQGHNIYSDADDIVVRPALWLDISETSGESIIAEPIIISTARSTSSPTVSVPSGETIRLGQNADGSYYLITDDSIAAKILKWDANYDCYYDPETGTYFWYNTNLENPVWQYWIDGVSSDYGDYGWMEYNNGKWYVEVSDGNWREYTGNPSGFWYITEKKSDSTGSPSASASECTRSRV